ncbi:MAG: PqiA/YebS family transporter subunit [Alphaproteobacteria bacterium]
MSDLVECHDCGLMLRTREVPKRTKAECPRCAAVLYRGHNPNIDHQIALLLAGLILFAIANFYPFITFELEGRRQTSNLITGVVEFFDRGLAPLALVVLLATIVIPLIKLLATLYVLLGVGLGHRSPHLCTVFRFVEILHPWAMMEVFLLGILVAYVKLVDLATLVLGPAIFAFGALIVVIVAADAALEPRQIWKAIDPRRGGAGVEAGRRDLVACHSCALLFPSPPRGHAACPRCGAPGHRRKPNSLTRTWALVLTAVILYIPANVFPVMTVISFGRGEPDTILSGVKALIEANMWPLAAIVFFASITVPVLKLLGLTFLMLSVHRRSTWRPRDRTRLYRVIESVGRWSMIDIFMISILIALVKLGSIATIEPGVGATSFAGVVVITMIASMTFDPRLMWDRMEAEHG